MEGPKTPFPGENLYRIPVIVDVGYKESGVHGMQVSTKKN